MSTAHAQTPVPRERGVIFSAPLIPRLLDGSKTQTRRIGKFRGADRVYWHNGKTHAWKGKAPEGYSGWVAEVYALNGLLLPIKCPYGAPGDRLWMRETWRAAEFYDSLSPKNVPACSPISFEADSPLKALWGKVRQSIFMPRWASRISLELLTVRVERLQDITEEDAKAEGAFFTDYGQACMHGPDVPCSAAVHPQRNGWAMFPTKSADECMGTARMAFANLWVRLHGDDSWDANPFVWVLSFRRVRP